MRTSGSIFRYAWSVVCWIALSGLVAALLTALYYFPRANEELRRFIELRFAHIYPELHVQVGSAKFIKNEGIHLTNLAVSRLHPTNGSEPIASVETMTLMSNATVASLLRGDFSIREVTLSGLNVNVHQTASGHLNFEELIPTELPPCRNDALPTVHVMNATVRYAARHDEPHRQLHIDGIDFKVRFKRLAASDAEDSNEMLVAFDGRCRSHFCQSAEIEGGLRTTDRAWTLRGRLKGVDLSSHLRSELPSHVTAWLKTHASFRGVAECEFEARGDQSQPPQFTFMGKVNDAQWQDPNWPLPVSNLKFDFAASAAGVEIKNATANYGSANLAANLDFRGYRKTSPFRARLDFEQLPVTRQLIRSFPAKLQESWKKLQYTGTITGSIDCISDGQTPNISTDIECHSVRLLHYKFPYPVDDCVGSVRLEDGHWHFDLQGRAGETPVVMQGAVKSPGPGYTGWWEVKATEWKTIDEALLDALPENGQRLARDLELRGRVGFLIRSHRDVPYVKKPAEIVVAFEDAWINYAKFPYPIRQIRGRLESSERGWMVKQFTGHNGNCQIRCNGYWDSNDPDRALQLDFDVQHARLDTALRLALPSDAQKAWDELRPRGVVNRLTVRLFKTDHMPKLDVDVRIDHRPPNDSTTVSNTVDLHPTWLPLQLTDVQGNARLRGGTLLLQGIEATHGRTRLRTNGTGNFGPNQAWNVNLTEFGVDGLQFTDTVLSALPRKLQISLRRLQAQGIYSIYGALNFSREASHPTISSGWDLALNVEQGSVDVGPPVQGVFGMIRLRGARDANKTWSRGELNLDSAMVRKVQLTNVSGPFLIDETRVMLGQHTPVTTGTGSNLPVTADVYQGKLASNATVVLTEDHPFQIDLSLRDTDVALIARDWQLGQGNVAGRGQLDLTLQGSARGRHTYVGNGRAQLQDGNLYELPLILALINRLGTGRADNAAFTTTDVAFHVRDSYVYFDQFDLSGDTITLKGIGDMSLDQQLSLDFYSIMGREQRWSPLVRPFLGEASRQFLQIHVNGTLSNPQTTQEVLPGINETLQQLFPEQPVDPASTTARRNLTLSQ